MCEYKKVLSAKRRKFKKCYPQNEGAENPHNMRVSGTFKKFPPGGRQACTSCAMMMAREYPERLFMSTQTVHRPGRRTRTCPGGAASPAVPYPVRKAAAPLTEYGCTKKTLPGLPSQQCHLCRLRRLPSPYPDLHLWRANPLSYYSFFSQEKNSISGAICKE